jgi:hypothetical protein
LEIIGEKMEANLNVFTVQESEFRRKVVNWLKELQKENTGDLPYTNPALFQAGFLCGLLFYSKNFFFLCMKRFDYAPVPVPTWR